MRNINYRSLTQLVAIVFLLSAFVSFAAEARYYLNIRDDSEETSETSEEEKEKSNGSIQTTYIEVNEEVVTLEITVKMKKSEQPTQKALLKWGFISEYYKAEKYDVLEEDRFFSAGEKTITLKNEEEVVATAVSEPFTYETRDGGNTSTEVGDSYAGYTVMLLSEDGAILAKEGSPSKYEKDAWLEKVLFPPAEKDSKGGKRGK